MGLTGFNKRRREAAEALAKKNAAKSQETVSPQPVKTVEDKTAESTTAETVKPTTTHKVGKKVQNADSKKDN